MANKRVVTIVIQADGTEVRQTTEEVEKLQNGLDDLDVRQAKQALESLNGVDLNSIKAKLDSVSATLKNVGGQVRETGQNLTLAVSAPIAALATLGIKFNATKEQALVAFGVILKDGEKAKNLFSDLNKFAADTPFELPELSSATKSLLAFGIGAEQIIPKLTQIGDISSGLNIPIGELAEIYGKARVQGRLFGEDINQLTGRGIPIIQELAKQFGVSESEVKKLVESGKVGFPQLEKAFEDMTSKGGQFEGMMAKQSQTFTGRLSSMADAANQTLGKITEPLFNLISANLPLVISILEQVGNAFTNLSPEAQNLILIVSGIIAAIGPVLVILGTLITFVGSVVGAISTLIPVLGAIGGAFAGVGGFIISFIGLIGEAGLIASFSALVSVLGGTVVSAIGTFLTALAPVAIALGVIIAVVTSVIAVGVALYAAWITNFGGIRDFTLQIWNEIETVINSAMTEISAYTGEIGGEITAWWTENYPIIKQAVIEVSEGVKAYLQTWFDAISSFWQAHGESIIAIISAAWSIIKTVVTTGIQFILAIIKGIAQAINGDWSGVWQTFLGIVSKAISAYDKIVQSLRTIIWNVLKLVVSAIINAGIEVLSAATGIGRNLIEGLINGMGDLASRAYDKAKSIISDVIGIFKDVPKVQSPSKVTTEIGEFISIGLANGMENRASLVKNTARKLADDTIKILQDATKEFNKLAGMSPEQISRTNQANDTKQATNDLQEIIKLRKELGMDQYQPLPDNPGSASAVLQRLQNEKQLRADKFKEWEDMAEEAKNATKEIQKYNEELAKSFEKRKESIENTGVFDVLNLQEEILLLGVTNNFEKIRIQNAYELKKLREDLANDGFNQEQIDEAIQLKELEQGRLLELQKILDVKKQIIGASSLEKGLNEQLATAQNGGRELSEYEKTLRKLNEDYKDISPAQREQILNTAAQIDAQKEFNEQYKQTYDFIRGALDILTDKSKSFGDKMKSIFGGIFNSFKKMLLDMTAKSLTDGLFGGGGNSTSRGGGIFDMFKNLLGSGQNSGSATGGLGGGNPFQSLLGGGNSGGGLLSSLFGGGGKASGILSKIPFIGKLFGGGASALAGAGSSAALGSGALSAAGVASALAPNAVAAGTAASSAGAAGAAGSGGLMSSMGALFTNPWTAVAAGAAIGGFFLFKHLFGDKSIKRIRESVKSAYDLNIDKNLAKQVKEIGETSLGKGAGENKTSQVIALDQVKDVLRAHAEQTGQSPAKLGINKADYTNANAAMNRFTIPFGGFREFGGAVNEGMAYIVGEKRPEVFVPNRPGTILPAIPSSNSNNSNNNNSGGSDRLMMIVLAKVEETLSKFSEKYNHVSPGAILQAGTEENPSAVTNTVLNEASKNPKFSSDLNLNTGNAF